MDETAPEIISGFLREHAALRQRVAMLESAEAEVTIQHAALVELHNTLEEQVVLASELQQELTECRQELTEQAAAQQAVEAERRQYQTLFDLAPDGYLVTNVAGVIHDANPTAIRLLGLPREYLVGTPLTSFIAPEALYDFHALLHALCNAQSPEQPWTSSFHPPHRQPFIGELTVAVRQEVPPHGRWYYWLLRDITARVEAEAALRQALAEHESLEREAQHAAHFALLGRLAAGLSHEIRNPLGAVVLYVDLLEEELHRPSSDGPEAIVQALAELKTNLARVDNLVQDYLSLVRVTAIERRPQDLGVTVQTWATEWQELAAASGVMLCLDDVACLGSVALHEPTLRRALLNLVQNAVEAMPRGGTLTLAGQRRATHVTLQVQDTGDGISAEQLRRIFEPLYTTKPGGTGLGLYIVQEIVAGHGGQVTVESVEGQGTIFTLTFPVTADPS